MSSAGRFAVKVLLLLGLPLLMLEAEATFRRGLGAKPDGDNEGGDSGQKVFSIDSYGATADGDTNNEQVSLILCSVCFYAKYFLLENIISFWLTRKISNSNGSRDNDDGRRASVAVENELRERKV